MTIIQQLEKRKKQLSHLNSPSNEEVYTPVALVEEMLDKLPKEIWTNPDLLWCDPCAKSGVFILEVIIRLMKNLPIENETERHNHIINNMVRAYVNVPRNRWIVSKTIYGSNGEIERVGIIDDINKIKIEEMPKFDVVVGNPPYKRNLHLEFLELAFNCLNENGKIIWLQPARWVQDPFAPYKKNSDYNRYKHLPFINFKLLKNSNETFNIDSPTQIMISYLDKSEKTSLLKNGYFLHNPFMQESPYQYSIFNKVKSKMKKTLGNVVKIIEPPKDKFCVSVSCIGAGHGLQTTSYLSGKKWTGVFKDGKLNGKKINEIKTKMRHVKNYEKAFLIMFDTSVEAENFIKSSNTKFIKFWMSLITLNVHIQFSLIPYMENYFDIWDDHRYYQYFTLTQEEIDYIESQVK